jgi:hypothetical protein
VADVHRRELHLAVVGVPGELEAESGWLLEAPASWFGPGGDGARGVHKFSGEKNRAICRKIE